jgi:RNA polymerase sigma-70 factor (ECF subfamily)
VTGIAQGIFERHARAVRRYLYRSTGDAAVADDLTQEVFLRVLGAVARYDGRDREAAWVFRIAQNLLRDAHRRARRSVEHAVSADRATPAMQDVGVDLDRALARLPDEEREALLLGEVAGLTYAEIAGITAATVAAVRSRIYRARQSLRAELMPPAPLAGTVVRGHHDD